MKKVEGSRRIRSALFVPLLIAFLSACSVTPSTVSGALWQYELSDTLLSYLALVPGTEDIVATGCFGTVAVISRDGGALWSAKYSETEESFLLPPVVTPEADVCLLSESGHVFCFSKDGSAWAQKWENRDYTRDISTPLMAQGQFIYAYFEKYGFLVQFSRDTGQVLRTLQLPPLSAYAGGSTGNDAIVDRVIRPGDTRLFVFTTTYHEDTGAEDVTLHVLDTGLAVVSESVLGTYAGSATSPSTYPSTTTSLLTIEYPPVEGDSVCVWFVRTTALSASTWETAFERRCIDGIGAMTTAGEVRPSAATPQAMEGFFTVQNGFFDASGRILTKSMGFTDGAYYIQHDIAEAGVVTSELVLDLGLSSGWEITTSEAGDRMDGVWDAQGDYYFACSVGRNDTPSETRVYRLATKDITAGATEAAPVLIGGLPAPSVHTNLLVLSDGRLVVGTKDGMICCFQTDSPGVDPGALRPVYYQTAANGGRR
jgi:hypothetical protein